MHWLVRCAVCWKLRIVVQPHRRGGAAAKKTDDSTGVPASAEAAASSGSDDGSSDEGGGEEMYEDEEEGEEGDGKRRKGSEPEAWSGEAGDGGPVVSLRTRRRPSPLASLKVVVTCDPW